MGLYESKKIFGEGGIQRKLTSAWLVVEIMHRRMRQEQVFIHDGE